MISCRKLQKKLLCLWQVERVLIFHKHENQNTVKVSYQRWNSFKLFAGKENSVSIKCSWALKNTIFDAIPSLLEWIIWRNLSSKMHIPLMPSRSLISRFPHFDDHELQHLSLEREIFKFLLQLVGLSIQTENRFKACIFVLM